MPTWNIRDSVRIEHMGWDRDLVPSAFNATNFEQILMSHGFVVAMLGADLYAVEFRAPPAIYHDRAGVGDVVLTVNGAGLRASWLPRQAVRAKPCFYTPARVESLSQAGVHPHDIRPVADTDVTGWALADAGTSLYSVSLRMPYRSNTRWFDLQVRAEDLEPVWRVGDGVHITSFGSDRVRRNMLAQYPEIDVDLLRTLPGRVTYTTMDRGRQLCHVDFMYPGRARPYFVQVIGERLRSSMAARDLDWGSAGSSSGSDGSDPFT